MQQCFSYAQSGISILTRACSIVSCNFIWFGSVIQPKFVLQLLLMKPWVLIFYSSALGLERTRICAAMSERNRHFQEVELATASFLWRLASFGPQGLLRMMESSFLECPICPKATIDINKPWPIKDLYVRPISLMLLERRRETTPQQFVWSVRSREHCSVPKAEWRINSPTFLCIYRL